MPKMKIDYLDFVLLPVTRDATDYELTYKMIESEYERQIFDTTNPITYKLKITLTGPKRATWVEKGFDEKNIPEACFEFGRRFLIEKIKEGKVEREDSYQINEEDVNFDIK
ncbi:MAG TPA: hypothetical protein VIK14_16580, partial [Ignavibacteria bacterium]